MAAQKDKRTLRNGLRLRLWADVDQDSGFRKAILTRMKAFRQAFGLSKDNAVTEFILEKLVFQRMRLETMERNAAEGEPFDQGVYTQCLNTAMGLVRMLGVKQAKHRKKHDTPAMLTGTNGRTLKSYLGRDEDDD